ncbi:M20/M25/M40 family metallo-hydrolase [Agromyces humi]|uniref:M20/M25/M40 family metallo-hydrolase n=1 Tax=Agromyces humi TaxID=1766800 RepID=UPI001F32166B|nr:M20/M25/M40 family metallo-hydrolase [Agromyces humi]
MVDGTSDVVETPDGVDVAQLCARLIRFDTTNHGGGRSVGEHRIAAWIAEVLRDAGYAAEVIGPRPERANVVVRVPGSDPALPALLVHGHLDVVPAEPADWTVDPFAGEIRDGYVWGRGATDMKDMVAMMVACLLDWARQGRRPRRDVVFAFVADEEDTGAEGALWLVDHRPDLFAGVEAGISESGGAPVEVRHADGHTVRLYPVATAERGTMHVRLRAEGTAGHGSRPTDDNPVAAVAEAVQRFGRHEWPMHLSTTVRAFLLQASDAVGHPADLETEAGVTAALSALGGAAEFARHTIRATSTPTMLQAGYKVNVIPSAAAAEIDVRCPPGYETGMAERLTELAGGVALEFTSFQPPVEAPVDGHWFDAIRGAIQRSDAAAVVVPFCMGGGTDAKAFARLGIDGYGFSPLGPDPEGRQPSGAHGVDERVPVAALEEGRRILDDFLTSV